MKLTYLILLTLAILACLASVTEAGRKNKDKRLSRKGKKSGKRQFSVGKSKRKGRKGGRKGKKEFNAEDEDEEDNKKKPRRGRGGKGKKSKRLNKKKSGGKKGRKGGSKKFNKGRGKGKGKESTRTSGKASYGKGGSEAKMPKMCKRWEIKQLPGKVSVEYQANFPDGYFEAVITSVDFGYIGPCETWYCVGKFWDIINHDCATCKKGDITYNVGERLPLSPYTAEQCMVDPANPQKPEGKWNNIGTRDFPMSLADIMKLGKKMT